MHLCSHGGFSVIWCHFFLSIRYGFSRNVVPKGCVSYTSVLSGWKQVALNWVKHHCNLEVLIPLM